MGWGKSGTRLAIHLDAKKAKEFPEKQTAPDKRTSGPTNNVGCNVAIITRPSRPIRCAVWIVQTFALPTDRQTDRRTKPVIEVRWRT